MRGLMAVTRALSDEGRVRILGALAAGELCVCQIVELLALAPSTVSKHLGLLRQARLIEARKHGRWIYYRLADEGDPTVAQALALVRTALAAEPAAREDQARLREILRIDPEVLCCQLREEPLEQRRARARAEAEARPKPRSKTAPKAAPAGARRGAAPRRRKARAR